jgi:hypothetical protein
MKQLLLSLQLVCYVNCWWLALALAARAELVAELVAGRKA